MVRLAECDASFFETAPALSTAVMELPVPVETVWAELAGDRPLAWCRMLSGGRYTSAPPHGVGATRRMTVARLLSLRERFIRWDEGHRQSFFATEASLPVFRRFGEDYVLEATPEGCRFTWTLAAEAPRMLRWATPAYGVLLRVSMAWLKRDTIRRFR